MEIPMSGRSESKFSIQYRCDRLAEALDGLVSELQHIRARNPEAYSELINEVHEKPEEFGKAWNKAIEALTEYA